MQEQKPQKPKKQSPTDPTRGSSDYAKYGMMGFQMAATIGVGVFGGIKLDEWLGLKKFPVFTIVLSLVSVFAAIYFVIKDFLKK
ncbi:MAG TPA: AtpZ/AtpI family protein [Bacteroidia bacterium]|jgi:F0F1-type ATP synthase assembly protein I